jgi:hypothetical protein
LSPLLTVNRGKLENFDQSVDINSARHPSKMEIDVNTPQMPEKVSQ